MPIFLHFAKTATMLPTLFLLLLLQACGDKGNHSQHSAQDHGTPVIAGDLIISDPWMRSVSAPVKTSAGYLTIKNQGTIADVLLSVNSDIAQATELHRSLEENGISLMRRVKKLEIPAGEKIELKPGSYHLMFIGLNGSIEAGATVTIIFNFQNAGAVEVVLPAKAAIDNSHHGH